MLHSININIRSGAEINTCLPMCYTLYYFVIFMSVKRNDINHKSIESFFSLSLRLRIKYFKEVIKSMLIIAIAAVVFLISGLSLSLSLRTTRKRRSF